MLSSQKPIRDGLKARHAKTLLAKNNQGGNPDKLASRLGDSSRIAANMARERGDFIHDLDEQKSA